ncbi:hypothetical protein PDJAM_G00041720 [Pangasius djambal]|uniref:Uncharacterized protein n=1 Tax=Pangasius djambal TaxID=1691987 RepID=A0ACC5YTG5_9TELE|nr:hypothetical protein [Pangasius djambal]
MHGPSSLRFDGFASGLLKLLTTFLAVQLTGMMSSRPAMIMPTPAARQIFGLASSFSTHVVNSAPANSTSREIVDTMQHTMVMARAAWMSEPRISSDS